jgi:uncharacterized membrane protein required for colicin V production
MFMALVAIIVVLASTYIWLTRGFFSAMVNMVCVIIAGAIAFGVVEPLAYMILDSAPERGFASLIRDASWAIALAVPFTLSVVALRLTVDKLLPHNTKVVSGADYAGGALCGAVAGVITAGVMVMTIGFLRVKTDFMGYQPVAYTGQGGVKGNLERNKDPLRPYVDEWTAGFYERLSLTSLRPSRPLASYHPEFHELPGTLRFNFEEGKSRNTFARKDFTVTHYYTVGDTERGTPMNDLTRDGWHKTSSQGVIDLDGKRMNQGYLAGFIIRFNSSAREGGRNAQILATNAQLRLVSESRDGRSSVATHPIAVIAQEDASDPEMARFWYDADHVTATSLGGSATPSMAFEFPLPPGYRPVSLYVKGARYEPPREPQQAFGDSESAGTQSRDLTIPTLAHGALNAADLDESHAVTVEIGGRSTQRVITASTALGFPIQKGQEQGLKTEAVGRGGHAVVEGDQRLPVTRGGHVDQNLRIDRFASTPDTVIVQVDVALNQPTAINGDAFDAAGRENSLYLLDSNGIPYQAVGYVYEDSRMRHVRFTPGQPLKSADELPGLSPALGDQKLKLIFRCSYGGSVEKLVVGKYVVANFNPPLALDSRQQ